jgi:hypothetical protein
VATLAVVPFLPAVDGEFLHWDDDVNFLDNPHYRGLGWRHLRWMFTTTLQAVYAPLAWMTHGLNYVVGGMDPRGYHVLNLALHAANVALFYLIARWLLAAASSAEVPGLAGSPPGLDLGAAAAALCFGVHPLRVESVAWISERRDVLGGLFYLLAVLTYVRGVAGSRLLGGRFRVLSLAAFACAILSKGLTMTLPLTLLILDAYPLRRSRLGWKALVREKVGHFVIAAAGAGLAVIAVSRGSEWFGLERHGLLERAVLALHSLWFYPSRLVWAEGLSPLHELPPRLDVATSRFIVPAVAVVVVTLVLLLARPRVPGALAAWIHSAVVLAPVSGLVHAGVQLVADRFSYLSGLGFALLLGGAVCWVVSASAARRVRPWLAGLVTGGVALVVLGWGAGAWRLSRHWVSSETLWQAAVEADPTCSVCLNNLGGSLMERARDPADPRLAEAETLFRAAIALRPGFDDARRNLLAARARAGRGVSPAPTSPGVAPR